VLLETCAAIPGQTIEVPFALKVFLVKAKLFSPPVANARPVPCQTPLSASVK